MIDMSAWGWPQWVCASWLLGGVILGAYLDGKPRTGNYSFGVIAVLRALLAAALVVGGFFQ